MTQEITVVLKTCQCGGGQILLPKTVGKFVNDEHKIRYPQRTPAQDRPTYPHGLKIVNRGARTSLLHATFVRLPAPSGRSRRHREPKHGFYRWHPAAVQLAGHRFTGYSAGCFLPMQTKLEAALNMNPALVQVWQAG